jgi:hypothetical protein
MKRELVSGPGAAGVGPSDSASPADRRAMEKTMSDIHRALAGQAT